MFNFDSIIVGRSLKEDLKQSNQPVNRKSDRTWTLIDIVRWGKDFFERKGVDEPRLTIELMLCELLGMNRLEIYTCFEKPLRRAELNTLHQWVKRRAQREPLQYIFNSTDFFGLKINLDKNVLIPRPETEILVEKNNQRPRQLR